MSISISPTLWRQERSMVDGALTLCLTYWIGEGKNTYEVLSPFIFVKIQEKRIFTLLKRLILDPNCIDVMVDLSFINVIDSGEGSNLSWIWIGFWCLNNI